MADDTAAYAPSMGKALAGALPPACERFYPKCCSYHEGWDDALALLTKVANVVNDHVYWLGDDRRDAAEHKALFIVEATDA